MLLGKNGINLVKFTKEHITDEYIGWLNDQEITRYMETGRFPISKDDIVIPDGRNNIRFAIFTNDLYIGTISIHKIEWVSRRAEIGYMIGNKEFWGCGVATEAIKLITDYGINRLGLNKIIAGTVEGNIGSEKVLEKNGYKKYAVEPQEYFLNGKFLDLNKHYILAEWVNDVE